MIINNESMMMSYEKLIIATQIFSLETVWMEGYSAGKNSFNGQSPYLNHPSENQYWMEGYEAGMLNQEALFPEYSVETSKDKKKVFSLNIKSIIIYGTIILSSLGLIFESYV